MRLLLLTMLLVMSMTHGEKPTQVEIYSDCNSDSLSRVFCLGMSVGIMPSFVIHTGESDEGTCVKERNCRVLFKAIKDEENDEVTFKIYSKFSELKVRHVFVALTHRPLSITNIDSVALSSIDYFKGHPQTSYMVALAEMSSLEAYGAYQPQSGRAQKTSDMFTYVPSAESGGYVATDEWDTPKESANVHIFEFKANLRNAKNADISIDFTGPVSPTIVVRIKTSNGTNSHVEVKSSPMPAMLLWKRSYSPIPDAQADAGMPLWVIILIIVVVLLLVAVVIFVCYYATSKRTKKA